MNQNKPVQSTPLSDDNVAIEPVLTYAAQQKEYVEKLALHSTIKRSFSNISSTFFDKPVRNPKTKEDYLYGAFIEALEMEGPKGRSHVLLEFLNLDVENRTADFIFNEHRFNTKVPNTYRKEQSILEWELQHFIVVDILKNYGVAPPNPITSKDNFEKAIKTIHTFSPAKKLQETWSFAIFDIIEAGEVDVTIGVFIDDVQITKAKGRNSTEAQNEAAIMFLKTGEYKEKYLEIIGAPVNLTDKAAKAKYEDIMKFSWSAQYFDYQLEKAAYEHDKKIEYRLTQLAQGRWKCTVSFDELSVEMPERLKGKAKKCAQKEILPKIADKYGIEFDLPDAKTKWADKMKELVKKIKAKPTDAMKAAADQVKHKIRK